jgi:hypothetical protein
MGLLGLSILAVAVGVGLIALLAMRLWLKLVWRLVMVGIVLVILAAVGVLGYLVVTTGHWG